MEEAATTQFKAAAGVDEYIALALLARDVFDDVDWPSAW